MKKVFVYLHSQLNYRATQLKQYGSGGHATEKLYSEYIGKSLSLIKQEKAG